LEASAVERLETWLASSEGLTRGLSTFTRRDVVRAVCEVLRGGEQVVEIERVAEEFLAGHQEVRPIVDSWLGLLSVDQRGYSTRELREVEAQAVACGLRRRREGVGVVRRRALRWALKAHDRLVKQATRAASGRGGWRTSSGQWSRRW
jgi:hypothetical protein